MKKLLLILAAFYMTSALARPTCLVVHTCMEYNGKIIDLRSSTDKLIDKAKGCDDVLDNCALKSFKSIPLQNLFRSNGDLRALNTLQSVQHQNSPATPS